MMKFIAAACLIAFVVAVNHHPQDNHHNHHPHPNGEIHCTLKTDCPDTCGQNRTAACENHLCTCMDSVVKRATCHNGHNCDSSCPDGQNGVCNQNGQCECGSHGKRAMCHDKDCDASCPDGQNGVCNSQNHCECGSHGKRAGEQCSSDADCPACTHGVPKCENHNDHEPHGHCHCAH